MALGLTTNTMDPVSVACHHSTAALIRNLAGFAIVYPVLQQPSHNSHICMPPCAALCRPVPPSAAQCRPVPPSVGQKKVGLILRSPFGGAEFRNRSRDPLPRQMSPRNLKTRLSEKPCPWTVSPGARLGER